MLNSDINFAYFSDLKQSIILALFVLQLLVGNAQIATDGTVGPEVQLTGPDFTINAALGQQVSDNLFHSFAQFNIQESETAVFTGPDSIRNVIARVTGGQASRIDGILRSEINNADFFLLNPSGLLFGPTSQIDVDGAFHVSTADHVLFDDQQGRFDALTPSQSVLTASSPDAFGFVSDDPASIAISGMRVVSADPISLVGGDIEIEGGQIEAQNTDLHVISVGSQAAVPVPEIGMEIGPITVSVEAFGTVTVRGGNELFPNKDTGGDLADSESGILVRAPDRGRIAVHAERLEITDGARIEVADVAANGASIDVFARDILIDSLGSDFTTGIFANTSSADGSVNNTIHISTTTLHIQDNGNITSFTRGAGFGGSVSIEAETIVLDGTDSNQTGIVTDTFALVDGGDAGNISILATSLTLLSGASVRSNTEGSGDGGNVIVVISDFILMDHGATALEETGILAESEEGPVLGSGGNIDITTGRLLMRDGAQISAEAENLGSSGSITIRSDSIDVVTNELESSEQTKIITSALNEGDAGLIHIETRQLHLDNSHISSENENGDGGSVRILGDGQLNLVAANNSSISTSSAGTGDAGRIEILGADQIQLQGQSSIQTESLDAGGGDIDIEARRLLFLQDSTITTSANGGDGNGGNITIDPDNTVLNRSRIVANAFGGNGGNISIATANLIQSIESVIQASSMTGINGNILISSPNKEIVSRSLPLDTEFIDVDEWIIEKCANRSGHSVGSFLVAGKGGAQMPFDLLPAPVMVTDEFDLSPNAATPAHRTGENPIWHQEYEIEPPCFGCD